MTVPAQGKIEQDVYNARNWLKKNERVRVRVEQFLLKYDSCNTYCRVKDDFCFRAPLRCEMIQLVRQGAKLNGRLRYDSKRYGTFRNGKVVSVRCEMVRDERCVTVRRL